MNYFAVGRFIKTDLETAQEVCYSVNIRKSVLFCEIP